MKVRPTSVTLLAECDLQLNGCTALDPQPITAVFPETTTRQVNVCRSCLEEMVRSGEWEVPGARVRQIVDIMVYDSKQRPQVAIETKKPPSELGASLDSWASRIHRNMLFHHAVPSTPLFWIIATSGDYFLWKHQDQINDGPADYSGSLKKQLEPYVVKERAAGKDSYFIDAVVRWLQHIQADGYKGKTPVALSETGLISALRSGQIRTEVSLQ